MKRRLRCVVLCLVVALGLGAAGLGPTEVEARQSMSFSPGQRSRTVVHRAYARARHGGWRGRAASRSLRGRGAGAMPRQSGGGDDEGAARAVPGGGFTMQNGILTYPAPARFQPQNLHHR